MYIICCLPSHEQKEDKSILLIVISEGINGGESKYHTILEHFPHQNLPFHGSLSTKSYITLTNSNITIRAPRSSE